MSLFPRFKVAEEGPAIPAISAIPGGSDSTNSTNSSPREPPVILPEAAELDEDAREHMAERQAIGEVDGELAPDVATRMAAERVYTFRLTDEPDTWFVMLAKPGDGLEKVRRSLVNRFGSDRVVEVRHRFIRQAR